MIYLPQYPKIPSFNIVPRRKSLFEPIRRFVKNRDVVRNNRNAIVPHIISIDNTF